MSLTVRLVRAWFVFGLIFASYMIQLGLAKLFRRYVIDPETGVEREKSPEWLKRRRKRVDARNAKRLLRGMLRLRGVYIKLGQVLSIMGGFLPRVYGKELEVLQDKVPPRPYDEIRRAVTESLGRPPDECFAVFEEEPIAAASLGQVHVAESHDGTKLAVKVLYPGIRDVVRVDMRVVRLAMNVYKWFVPVENIDSAYEALVDLLRRETDYVHEANCMVRMGENFSAHEDIIVPDVVRSLSTKDVLTMTFIEGIKITDLDRMRAAGIDPYAVATRLTQCFYEQMFVHRFFHADPHPGNFLVQRGPSPDSPRIVILDFGAICEVAPGMIDGMVDVLQGFFEQNEAQVVEGIRRIGFIAEGGNHALVEKTIITYFQKLLKFEDRSAGAIMRARHDELERLANPEVERRELRELMKSVHYPEGWFYVERASVLLFWLVGQIDSQVDTFGIGFPYILPFLAERTAKRSEAPPASVAPDASSV